MHRAVKRAHWRDAGIAALVFAVVFLIGAVFDLFERFSNFTRAYEQFEVDELLIALFAAIAAFLVYSLRRTIAFRREHAARLLIYRDLLREMHEAGLIRLALEQARQDRSVAHRSKSAFLSHMSHEMRTPLNAIIGFAQMLGTESENVGSKKRSDYAAHIVESGTSLLRTVEDILDLSDASGSGLKLSESEFDIAALVRECITQCHPDAAVKGVRLVVEVPEAPQRIYADETRIRQLMCHLIGNGLKFTPSGGEVSVTLAKASDGRVRFCCSDTGTGMSEEEIAAARQPFARPTGLQAKQTSRGTGVGLPLCSVIAAQHDADLAIESGPGGGTTVTLVLPVWRCMTATVLSTRARETVSRRA